MALTLRRIALLVGWVILGARNGLAQDLTDFARADGDVDLEYHEEWRWSTFTTRSGLPSDDVLEIVETTGGTTWVSTRKGLAWYDGFEWHRVTAPDIDAFASITTLEADPAGAIVAIIEGRLYRGDDRGLVPVPVEPAGRPEHVADAVPLDDGDVLVLVGGNLHRVGARGLHAAPAPTDAGLITLHRTETGGILVGAFDGLHELVDGRWRHRVPYRVDLVREQPWGGLIAGTDSPEAVGVSTWLARDDRRLTQLPEQGGSHVIAADLAPDGGGLVVHASGRARIWRDGQWHWLAVPPAPFIEARSIRFRANGDLWVGTDRGLHLCRLSSTRWSRLPVTGLPGASEVNDLLWTSVGALWVATNEGLVIHREDGTLEHRTEILGQPLGVVTGLAEDPDGNVWVGSGSAFFGAFRRDADGWRHFGVADGLAASYVHRIVRDRRGRLWFLGLAPEYGKAEPGAFVHDGRGFERWGVAEGLASGRVYAMVEDEDGALWFGTSGGLSRWAAGTWTHWTTDDGLRSRRVFTVAAGTDGRVWIGHREGHGLGRLDPDGRIEYLDANDGLVNPAVRELRFDDGGWLWIATENGVSVLRDDELVTLHRGVGLEHPYVWPILPIGDLVYIGTIGGGVYVFDRRAGDGPPPRVSVEPPLVDLTRVFFRWRAFAHGGELAPAGIETRHRIDDAPWTPWSLARETIADALPPGPHILTVQARGLLGDRGGAGTSVPFTVRPVTHRHPLFAIALVAWVASLVVLIVIYVRRQRRQRAALREREHHFRTLIEEGSDLIAVLDEAGRVIYLTPSVRRLLGYEPEALIGASFADIAHTDDRRELVDFLQAEDSTAMARWSQRLRMRRADGDWCVLEVVGRVMDGADGSAHRIINGRDVTDRHAAESALRESRGRLRRMVDVQRMLLKELDHRVRNNLASLLSLIDLTRQTATGVDQFASSMAVRTRAMAATHDLLRGRQWHPIPLRVLLRAVLPADLAGRIEADGPEVLVSPAKAQALAMVVSELITNSLKYGAMRARNGVVRVVWTRLEADVEGGRLELRWTESAGPPIEQEPQPGVGSSLIRGLVRSELRGRARLVYTRDGARHVLEMDLDGDVDGDDTPAAEAEARAEVVAG